ncbi:hypothetical protein CANCADRAFT_45469 [Tortispora caseinolytica NRRL Y-17796]|uniref:Pre-mRNA polyadenylation factor FIP1 n=1 Tax=Tortispora caseinolytica NRRL Y-17796 TaxID=767744 RepID=A0A1E4TB57_9ASCO|nr:hypothetical protein CANCADRAFT_45469 [Tortispora caseinolytica NRRL Y-17796]
MEEQQVAEDIKMQPEDSEQPVEQQQEEQVDDEEMEDDSESDSDSDIEVIINSSTAVQPPTVQKLAPKLAQPEGMGSKSDTLESGMTIAVGPKSGNAIDLSKIGEYNGVPITEVPIELLEEKPWRRPGADVSDYFNYGFDEFTWQLYCENQDSRRAQYDPQVIMMSLFGMSNMANMQQSAQQKR